VPDPRAAALLLALAAGGLAGCGSSGGASEAAKPGSQIIADAEAAIDHVHSFHVAGTGIQDGTRLTIDARVQIPGRISASVAAGPAVLRFIGVDGHVYVDANAAYYERSGGAPAAIATRLAGRWIIAPSGPSIGLGGLVTLSSPVTAGLCALGPHFGSLTVRGTSDLAGQRVIEIQDAGNRPASTPTLFYVRASATPLPVKVVQIGPQHAGGTPSAACEETRQELDTNTDRMVETFGDYDSGPAITAPADAVTVAGAVAPSPSTPAA